MIYNYGIIFWNEKTDHEVCVFFQANDYFEAERIIKPIHLDEYIKGCIIFIGDEIELKKSYFNVSLEELMKHPKFIKK